MLAHGLTPILNVSDLGQSIAWFKKLGWEQAWVWGEPPTFGSVRSGVCQIFLCQGAQGGRGNGGVKKTFGPDGDQTADKGAWMSIWVDDVDAVHRHCVEQGLDVAWPPTDMPWNVREMHVPGLTGAIEWLSYRLLARWRVPSPTRDFGVSKRFYEALGFENLLDGDVAIFKVGSSSFILQRRSQEQWVENCLMQLLLDDVDAWWAHHAAGPPGSVSCQAATASSRPALGPSRAVRPVSHSGCVSGIPRAREFRRDVVRSGCVRTERALG